MIGKQALVIDASDFVRGMSTSGEISDGGFSPDTDSVNPQVVPGAIYAPALRTDKSTNLVGEIIASCIDPINDADAFNRIAVSADSTDDGRVYSVDADGDLALIGAEDTGRNYVQGRTDMIAYKNEVYITTDTHIVRVYDTDANGSLDTLNTTFASFTNSVFVPHPAIVYEDNAYYGDGNLLLRQTAANSAPATILTLPADSIIIALGIDPGSGKMLISYAQGFKGISLTNSQFAKVGFYDGSSNKLSRTVIVEEIITAFPTAGGVQYAGYGNSLGYWNGSGISFLRKFTGITYSNTRLLYKHHFAAIGSTLYFLDGRSVIAHGHVIQGGSRVFWPAFYNQANSNNFTYIASLGQNLLSVSYSSAQHFTVDISSTASTNTMAFVTNWYRFARPIIIRSAFVEFADTVTSGVTPATLSFNNRAYHGGTGSFNVFASLASSTGGATRETVVPIAPQIGNQATTGAQPHIGRTFRFRIITDTTNTGIARIIIYYDVYE